MLTLPQTYEAQTKPQKHSQSFYLIQVSISYLLWFENRELYKFTNLQLHDFTWILIFFFSCSVEENLSIEQVLTEHVSKVMAGKPSDVDVSKNLINVRRKHLFADGIKKIGRSRFQASLTLSVKFADELGFSEGQWTLEVWQGSFFV